MLLILTISLTFNTASAAVNYQRLYSFGSADQLGVNPQSALIEATNGLLYGTTYRGGTNNAGTVFTILKNGSGYKALHHFGGTGDASGPWATLLQAGDGMLYGTASAGGANGKGAIFRLNPDGTAYSLVYSSTNADVSGMVEGNDGGLYGTTSGGGINGAGTIFRVNKNGSGYGIIHNFLTNNFDGQAPAGGLFIATDGYFYGTTQFGGTNREGTVFRISADGTSYQVVHHFGVATDGYYPLAGVFEGTDGILYGTTPRGGTNQVFGGTVFKMSKDGSGYTILYSFAWPSGNQPSPVAGVIEGADGMLYGVTPYGGTAGGGMVFKLSRDGTSYSALHNFDSVPLDGDLPIARLLKGSDGKFYGATPLGGGINSSFGTLFSIASDGSSYAVLHRFGSTGNDANVPGASLLQGSDDTFYGTTIQGGSNSFDSGAVFKINRDGSGYAMLHSFGGSSGEGRRPVGGVIEGHDGMLYGTTSNGGTNDAGIVFKMRIDASSYTVLHSFSTNNLDGRQPPAGVIEGTDGCLYGTTQLGGTNGVGTVFKLKKDGTAYQILHSFSVPGGDGVQPYTGVIEASDGLLYGTTIYGGTNYYSGTVFRLSKDGSFYSILHSFGSSPGPYAALTEASDGMLYGTTYVGGASNVGMVFKMNRDGGGYSVIKSFTGSSSDGGYPTGSLTEGNDGALYGTSNGGTVFKLSKDGTSFATLHQFTAAGDGRLPLAGLTKGNDGALYGVTSRGGDLGFGTVFRLWPSEAPTMMKIKLSGTASVTFGGVPGLQYTVWRSSDLASWSNLNTIVMPTLGIYTNLDGNAPPQRAYYRAAYVQ